MDEYITREQAATVFKTFYGKSLRVMLEALEEEHAADVRPVVLCKECKYRNTDKYGSWCLNDYEHNLKDDDFCSRGKRK